jgi:hypothetical protein
MRVWVQGQGPVGPAPLSSRSAPPAAPLTGCQQGGLPGGVLLRCQNRQLQEELVGFWGRGAVQGEYSRSPQGSTACFFHSAAALPPCRCVSSSLPVTGQRHHLRPEVENAFATAVQASSSERGRKDDSMGRDGAHAADGQGPGSPAGSKQPHHVVVHEDGGHPDQQLAQQLLVKRPNARFPRSPTGRCPVPRTHRTAATGSAASLALPPHAPRQRESTQQSSSVAAPTSAGRTVHPVRWHVVRVRHPAVPALLQLAQQAGLRTAAR